MNSKPRHSVAEVLTKHIDNYKVHYGTLTSKQNKVITHITQCKTALQGGHAYSCTTCGDTVVTYNSCRDRHCPKCQGISRASWVNDRVDELLPVGYFHVVFTCQHRNNISHFHRQTISHLALQKTTDLVGLNPVLIFF